MKTLIGTRLQQHSSRHQIIRNNEEKELLLNLRMDAALFAGSNWDSYAACVTGFAVPEGGTWTQLLA